MARAGKDATRGGIKSLAWLVAVFAVLVNQLALPLHAGGFHDRAALPSGIASHDGHAVGHGFPKRIPGDTTPDPDGQGGCHFCRLAQAVLPVPQFTLLARVEGGEPAWQRPPRSAPATGMLRQGHPPRAPPPSV